MDIQVINTGTADNSHDGEPLRGAMTKVNSNFASVNADLLNMYLKSDIQAAMASDPNFLKYLYKNRVVADGGVLRNEATTLRLLKNSDYQDMMDNIKFAWFGEAGSKIRTSGINSYVTKAYTTNYNPVPRYGPELVVNGGFDTDSGWAKQTGWTISDGVATKTSEVGLSWVYQEPLTVGKLYKCSFTITQYTGGNVKIGAGAAYGIPRTSVGTYTDYLICTVAPFAGVISDVDANFIGSVDNISFREVLNSLTGSPTDATQTTGLSQPFLSGNIAPNERYAIKNPNGGARFMTHPTISFAANDAWSITTVLNWNGKETSEEWSAPCGSNPTNLTSMIALNYSGANAISIYNGTAYAGIANEISGYIGKVFTLTITVDESHNCNIYINGIILRSVVLASNFFDFGGILVGYSASGLFNGSLSAHIIRSGALTQSQITSEYNFLRAIYPEIPSVKIGNQEWATSNTEMVCTPQGNVIQEMQPNTNVEKIVNGGFDTDTGWVKTVGAIIENGVGKLASGANFSQTVLTPNKWYKATFTVSGYTGGSCGISSASTANGLYITANGTYTIYFNANGTIPTIFRLSSNTSIEVTFDNVSVQEIGWAGSQELYDGIYAQTAGTVEQKTYAAVKAAAMWSHYNNDATVGAVYGKLYNWFAVKLLQIDIDYFNVANPTTPWGWKVPADTDFTTLQTTLGGSAVAGGNMKKEGLSYFGGSNSGATNSSGFSGLGVGLREHDTGLFKHIKLYVNFSSITNAGGNQTIFALEAPSALGVILEVSKQWGTSLRLIKN